MFDIPFQQIESDSFTISSNKKIKTNIESFILCPTCDKKFDNITIPKNLPCGHTICQDCIQTLKRMSIIKDQFKCPFDKQRFLHNDIIATSFYIIQLNQQIQENLDSLSLLEKKIRSLAYTSMKTVLVNTKYDENLRKNYSETISSDIKKKLKEYLKEEYTFSYVLFLFNKEFCFSFAGSSFHFYNDEVHCHEKYEDNDWVCVTYIFIFKNSNNKGEGNEFCLFTPNTEKGKKIEKLTLPEEMLKLVTYEIDKYISGKIYDEIDANRYSILICENIKSNLNSLQTNYSYCIDCIISNMNVEEYGRFGGHFKKEDVLRYPIKYNIPHTIYCLVNVCCFKTRRKDN